MIKVKIIYVNHEKDLESKINEFIKDKKIKDIQYSNSVSIFAEEQIYCFSAMIIYEI